MCSNYRRTEERAIIVETMLASRLLREQESMLQVSRYVYNKFERGISIELDRLLTF